MLIAADTPIINNVHQLDPADQQPPFDLKSLPDLLEAAGLGWKNYGGYAFAYIKGLKSSSNNVASGQFVKDAAAGDLPAVSWVYAPETTKRFGDLSEHPVGNITHGMRWSMQQVDAIVRGGLWDRSAIFITWDDWGGWYDHVTPPDVEHWHDGSQFRYGPRVPCLVLGPYAKAGHVSSLRHSHVSLLKFCETMFGLPHLTERDRQAHDMLDCFDFAQKPLAPPAPAG
jgi:phospholipase C